MPSVAFWFQSPESWSVFVLVTAAGSLLGLTGLFVVQLRRQVQAAWTETGLIYKRSSARFAAVGDLVEGILFETDLSRTLTFTNQAFHSLTGFRERDLRSGLTLIDLFDPEERLRLQEDLETADDLQAVRVRNCNLQCRDGAVVPVRLRMAVGASARFWPILAGYLDIEQIDGDVNTIQSMYVSEGFLDVEVSKLLEFSDENFWVDDEPVADDGCDLLSQNSGRDKVKFVGFIEILKAII